MYAGTASTPNFESASLDRSPASEVREAMGRAHELTGEICRLADMICGPQPEAVSAAGAPMNEHSGILPQMGREASMLNSQISRAMSAVERIRSAID